MWAKYILAVLSVGFLVAALRRVQADGGRLPPQARTWLVIAVIFAAVSAWLFVQG
jgi:hypothetical protein